MTRKTYQSVHYHIVFRTKDKQPYLHSGIRRTVYEFIWKQGKKLGFYLHRIGGNDWHVHLLIHIPPKIAVSEAVSLLKGSSSHYINHEIPGKNTLYWQRGYGVLTVSNADFKTIYEYVKNQERHHQEAMLISEYETVEIERSQAEPSSRGSKSPCYAQTPERGNGIPTLTNLKDG